MSTIAQISHHQVCLESNYTFEINSIQTVSRARGLDDILQKRDIVTFQAEMVHPTQRQVEMLP